MYNDVSIVTELICFWIMSALQQFYWQKGCAIWLKKPFVVILFYHNVLFSILMPSILIGVLCHCKSCTFLFVGNCDEWATSYNQQTSTIEYLYGINYSAPYHRVRQCRNYRFVLKVHSFFQQCFAQSLVDNILWYFQLSSS